MEAGPDVGSKIGLTVSEPDSSQFAEHNTELTSGCQPVPSSAGSSAEATPALLSALRDFCEERVFAPGEQLRRKGEHYRHMYLLTEGDAIVDFGGGTRDSVKVGPGAAIGEMSFLSGKPATAEVVSLTPVRALELDDATLSRFEAKRPDLIVALLRMLGHVMHERNAQDLIYAPSLASLEAGKAVEVLLCRDADMLGEAQALRYETYCVELGHNSVEADHERRNLSDGLDGTAYVFIARSGGESVGTLRVNLASDGSLGMLQRLYGMDRSPHHPAGTALCSKFVVKQGHRQGPAARQLIAAAVKLGLRHEARELYVDATAQLLPFYRAMGFRYSAEKFFQRETGPTYPMMLDLTEHGARFAEEMTPRQLLTLYMRSRFFKLADAVSASAARHLPGKA